MNTATTITRLGATTAALVLLTGAALAGPASAKDGADDNPSSISDDSTNRTTTDDNPSSISDDSTNRRATDDTPGASSDDSTNRASSKSQARKVKRGSCTAATDWKLKAKPRDGRMEVEFEVDSNRIGQRWTYTLRHDGTVKASGTRTTRAPSGSFSVERRLPNAPGVHTFSATATNVSTGETCQASLKI
ncbi:MAG: hypothetical protein WCF36_14310 [Candidatus Nanopelagicales bacterium]